MEIVTVTPLTHTVGKDELSYFTDRNISEGSLVSVNIRNRLSPALVIRKESVSNAKTRIKSSSYGLKKIDSVLTPRFYSKDIFEAARETADFYATSLGSVLKAVTPKAVLDESLKEIAIEIDAPSEMKPEASVLQLSLDDRLTFYKQHIRESLARGKITFICVPTRRDAEYISDHLKKGIEHLTFTLHGDMTTKATLDAWKAVSNREPKLIVSTGLFLSVPCGSIDTLILEREASENYYTRKRPHFSIAFFARALARRSGAKLITGDSVLSIKSFKEYNEGSLSEIFPLQKRYTEGSSVSVVDMTDLESKERKSKLFPFLSFSALQKIYERENEHAFVYTARRGLSPTTTCGDCGFTFSCQKCSSPLVLHGKERNRSFMCHVCNYSKEPRDTCPECGSWKLTQLGIGSEKIADLMEKALPDRKIVRMDSDNASTRKKEDALWKSLSEAEGSILVGTELALNRIRSGDLEVGTVLVASMDSLLTYPNYSANEKAFRNLIEMTLISKRETIIQTRIPEQRLLSNIKSKKVIDFLREEVDIREQLSYPPFSVLITVTYSGNQDALGRKERLLNERFATETPVFFRSISEKRRGQIVKKMLIRLENGDWHDKDLLERLKSLSLEYKVAVNPPVIV